MTASVAFAVVVTAAVTFAMIVVVVIASHVRVVNELALEELFYLFVSIAAAAASESDALLKERVLCAGTDAAADKKLYTFVLEENCERLMTKLARI